MRRTLPATQPPFRARPPRHPLAAAGSVCALILLTALAACGPGGQPQAGTASRPGPSATPSSPLPAGTTSRPKPAATPRYQLPAGSFVHKIKVGGVEGSYRTYRPASLPAGAPLVVMLPPSTGSAGQMERDYHWDAEADSGHFVVAYSGLNYNAFISAIVAEIERHNPIDSGRVYAAGISLGGIKAYYLACSSTIFAAIGVVSGTEFDPAPTRHRSLSSTSMAPLTTSFPTSSLRAAPSPPSPSSTRPGGASTIAVPRQSTQPGP